MVGRHIERFEVVIVVFDFRAIDDFESQAGEDPFDLLSDQGQRVPVADPDIAPRQGDVDRAGRTGERREGVAPLAECVLDLFPELVRLLPQSAAHLRRGGGDRLEERLNGAPLPAQVPVVQRLEVFGRLGQREVGVEGSPDFVGGQNVSHREPVTAGRTPYDAAAVGACASRARSARCAKASGSRTARSASAFRSRPMPVAFNPCMNWL